MSLCERPSRRSIATRLYSERSAHFPITDHPRSHDASAPGKSRRCQPPLGPRRRLRGAGLVRIRPGRGRSPGARRARRADRARASGSRSPGWRPSSSSRAGCSSRSTPTPGSSAWASRSSRAAPEPSRRPIKEIEPYLVGKDPRRVVHHWQAIYRHAFYRGGPILTSALSGIDMALWDIKGKALGVPGLRAAGRPDARPGPRLRPRRHARSRSSAAAAAASPRSRPARPSAGRRGTSRRPAEVHYAAEQFAELRKAAGDDVDIAIDFHGAISPATAKLLIKALEPYQPMFIEEPCQARTTTSWPRSPAARTCRSPPASASSPSGASARCWRSAPRRSCSPTCATPAASPRCG